MKKQFFKDGFLLLVVLMMVFVVSCNRVSRATGDNASTDTQESTAILNSNVAISVKETVKWKKAGKPALTVVIANDGAADACNLVCTINVLNNNRLVETQSVDLTQWLASLELKSKENTLFEVVMVHANEHTDYTAVNFEFGWIEKYDNTVVISSQTVN